MSNNYFLPLIDFRNCRKKGVPYYKKSFQLPCYDQFGQSLLMKNKQISMIKEQCNQQDSKFLIQKYYEPLTLPKKSDKNKKKSKHKFLIKKDGSRNFINYQKYKNGIYKGSRQLKDDSSFDASQMRHNKDKRYLNVEKFATQNSSGDIDVQEFFPKHKSAVKMQQNSEQYIQHHIKKKYNQKYSKEILLNISQIQKCESLFEGKTFKRLNASAQYNPQIQKLNYIEKFEQDNHKLQNMKQKLKSKKKIKYLKYYQLDDQIVHNQSSPYVKSSLKYGSFDKYISFQKTQNSKQDNLCKGQTRYGIGPWGQKTKDNFINNN